MTGVIEGAKRLVGRGGDLGPKVEALAEVVDGARGRLPDPVVDHADGVVQRAAGRLRLSADHTVVALAGGTGSGKSSTFNALTDLELAAVGVRRPTTSWASACVWGAEDAEELLDWLEIPPRHRIIRDSMLSTGREDKALDGVVLLDLPDHDSTEVSHHLEVERLAKMADLFVWVLDPQKYADAAIHDRFLAPLRSHKDVMLVVLNHIDTVPPERRASMIDDVKRLLANDGLDGVPVLPISARQRIGIDELKSLIADRVKAKKATKARMAADVRAAAEQVREVNGTAKTPSLSKERVSALENAFADAAGVPTVVRAVERSTSMRANRATGWPIVAWVTKLKPDPLKRLHLNLGSAGKELTGAARTSVPQASQVERARVDSAVRDLADDVSQGLSKPWASSVRRASTSRLDDLSDRLDAAVARTDLGAEKLPWWVSLVWVLQWILITAALVGLAWLGLMALGAYAGMRDIPTPEWHGFPWPFILLIGGVGLGILLALCSRFLVALAARSRARAADKRLRASIDEVADDLVVTPVRGELAAHEQVRKGLATALS